MYKAKPLKAACKTAAILSLGACAGATLSPYFDERAQLPKPVTALLVSAFIASVSVRRYVIEEKRNQSGPS